jgi:hypothetical protein
MLTENDVVQAVVEYLKNEDYCIEDTRTTAQRGIDIIAVKRGPAERLRVEAKGATSSKAATARFGKRFTKGQAKSHVSVAFYCAAKLRQRRSADSDKVAMAFPDDATHRALIDDISDALQTLGITVFFVNDALQVTPLQKR